MTRPASDARTAIARPLREGAARMADWSRKPFNECRLADERRPGDVRSAYGRDDARIVHGAGFRRLQGKTQVMGVAEGDFHRTRLTNSIEVAQIGCGVFAVLKRRQADDEVAARWLPSRAQVAAAYHAHDLGHPPFGHGAARGAGRELRRLRLDRMYTA